MNESIVLKPFKNTSSLFDGNIYKQKKLPFKVAFNLVV